MTLFSFVLFIHVLSAIAVFVALALEGAILMRLRSAETLDQLRFPSAVFRRLGPVYGISFAGILLGGIYLADSLHLRAAWVPAALLATLLLLAVGGIVTGRRMSRIRRALREPVPPFQDLLTVAKSNSLVISYGFRAGILVGIVFLMTAMPALLPSVVALILTTIAGVFLSIRLRETAILNGHNSLSARPAASGSSRS